MNRTLSTALLPNLLSTANLPDQVVVVTDVLRASTTMIAALHNGARDVIPIADIPAAIALRDSLRKPQAHGVNGVVLGGERRGVIIPGFDQGNSPLEFTPHIVAGKRLILCTTNGTVAVERCRTARRILIGAMVNVGAVASRLSGVNQVTIVCAGTAGHITLEDILFAGALIDRLTGDAQTPPWELDDSSTIALDAWRGAMAKIAAGVSLAEQLASSRGGRNLLQLGYRDDIEFCSQIDAIPLVPELDHQQGSIRLTEAI